VRLRFGLVAGWAALIFLFSSFPNPPGASGGEWRYDAAHVAEYAILGALLAIALGHWRRTWPWFAIAVTAWLVASVYGMSDEFHQSFVPSRDANWLDVGFDSFGAALGVVVVTGIRAGRHLGPHGRTSG